MIRVIAGLVLILGVIWGAAAAAQTAPQGAADIFTVSQVPVRAEAASAEEARLIAQDQGRTQALQILLQRLTPSSDWPYLPRPSLNELLDLQVGFEVEHERFSTLSGQQNRYLADITYSFRRDRVRALLRSEGVAFSESQAAPALVLPVYEVRQQSNVEGQRQLWGDANDWAAAWYDMDFSHELVPMVLPLGDLSDMTVVTVNDVVQGNWDALRFLANRYNVSTIYVAHAVLIPTDAANATLFVRMTELTADGVGQVIDTRVSGPYTLPTGEEEAAAAATTANAEDAQPLNGLGARAITLLSGELQERWKARTLVSYDTLHRIQVTTLFDSLEQWETIRTALEGSATVDSFDTHALSARGAELAITFVGSPQQLMITLDQRGVTLSGNRGYWDLRVKNGETRELPNTSLNYANGSNTAYASSGAMPPVETVTVQPHRQENAPVLTQDDIQGIFDDTLTQEEIEERRRRGLGDQPGTMQPVGD